MAELTSVAKTQDVIEGEMAVFEVAGERVGVANVDGSFHAFSDICTHQQCSLASGELEGKTVTCPCHGSQFDVTSGAVLNPPATEPVPVFSVQVEGDEIKVEM